jgi:hypothetical protein
MKTTLLFLSVFLSASLFGQIANMGESRFDDGYHHYTNDSIYVMFLISDYGRSMDTVVIHNRITGAIEKGSGYWHGLNLNGVDADYNGPDGWYEMHTNRCYYELDKPETSIEPMIIHKFDCKNGEKDSVIVF